MSQGFNHEERNDFSIDKDATRCNTYKLRLRGNKTLGVRAKSLVFVKSGFEGC